MTIKCPETFPYQMAGACCANFLKKNDTGIDARCDGGLITPADPAACCYNDRVFVDEDCEAKKKVCEVSITREGEWSLRRTLNLVGLHQFRV